MKIYTRKGDKGYTSLIGGTRLSKNHIRIDSYGDVDELNAWIGLLADTLPDARNKDVLIPIQDNLFTLGAQLASDPDKSRMEIPELEEGDITRLEQEIDKMEQSLPTMKSFILPGGAVEISYCHIARAVCRRAERKVIALMEKEQCPGIIAAYLNRLSDFLFMLARKTASDLSVAERKWPLKQ